MTASDATLHDDFALIGSPELARRTGITFRQLDYWCRSGVLRPSVPAQGSGTQRLFARDELRLAQAVGQLALLGLCDLPLFQAAYDIRKAIAGYQGSLVVTVALVGRRTNRASLEAKATVYATTVDEAPVVDAPCYIVVVPGVQP